MKIWDFRIAGNSDNSREDDLHYRLTKQKDDRYRKHQKLHKAAQYSPLVAFLNCNFPHAGFTHRFAVATHGATCALGRSYNVHSKIIAEVDLSMQKRLRSIALFRLDPSCGYTLSSAIETESCSDFRMCISRLLYTLLSARSFVKIPRERGIFVHLRELKESLNRSRFPISPVLHSGPSVSFSRVFSHVDTTLARYVGSVFIGISRDPAIARGKLAFAR